MENRNIKVNNLSQLFYEILSGQNDEIPVDEYKPEAEKIVLYTEQDKNYLDQQKLSELTAKVFSEMLEYNYSSDAFFIYEDKIRDILIS